MSRAEWETEVVGLRNRLARALRYLRGQREVGREVELEMLRQFLTRPAAGVGKRLS